MKKIVLATSAILVLATQSFGANTAMLSKVMAKMTGDILALKASNVYLKEKVSVLKNDEGKLAIGLKGTEILKGKLAKAEKEIVFLKNQISLLSNKKNVDMRFKVIQEQMSLVNANIKNVKEQQDSKKITDLTKRLNILEKTLKTKNTLNKKNDEIDPEVEKRILNYINSK